MAIVREGVTLRLRRVSEIERELELPLLASLRHGRRSDPEAFKVLRRNLSFLSHLHPCRRDHERLGREDKSTVALSLARAYATGGRRTLLIDCDLRRGRISRDLGVPDGPGLADHIEGRLRLTRSATSPGTGSPSSSW